MSKETFIGLERAIRNKKAKAKRDKDYYQKLKESDICLICGKRKKVPPHVRCQICIDKLNARYETRKEEEE